MADRLRILLLTLHILGGSVGLLSGAAAMIVRKGGARHRTLGNVFTLAMLTLAGSGLAMAVIKMQFGNMAGAAVTFYLIGTAWRAGSATRATSSLPDRVALGAGSLLDCLLFALAVELLRHPDFDRSASAVMTLIFATVVLLALAGDVRMLLRGLTLRRRIARHAWRMSFALFIATGSFFLGQQQVFPRALRGSPLLMILGLFPLPLLVYWAVRVRFGRTYQNRPVPHIDAVVGASLAQGQPFTADAKNCSAVIVPATASVPSTPK